MTKPIVILKTGSTTLAPSAREGDFEDWILAGLELPQNRVRIVDAREAARRFVEHRLGQYERIWDGCGCRIDYLAQDPEPREEAP